MHTICVLYGTYVIPHGYHIHTISVFHMVYTCTFHMGCPYVYHMNPIWYTHRIILCAYITHVILYTYRTDTTIVDSHIAHICTSHMGSPYVGHLHPIWKSPCVNHMGCRVQTTSYPICCPYVTTYGCHVGTI